MKRLWPTKAVVPREEPKNPLVITHKLKMPEICRTDATSFYTPILVRI